MKKIIIPFVIVATSLFMACNKQDDKPMEKHLNLDITINDGVSTKAVKSGWEAGDAVYVFFTFENVSPVPCLTLTYDGSKWIPDWTAGLEEKIAGTASGTLTAFYSPIGSDITSSLSYWSMFNGYFNHSVKSGVYWLQSDNVPYSVSGGTLTATLNMECAYQWVNFVIKDIAPESIDNWTFACDNMMKSCIGVVSAYSVGSSNGSFNDPVDGFVYGGEVMFGGIFNSLGANNDYTFTIVNNNGTPGDDTDDVTYQATFTDKTLNQLDQIVLPDISTWPTI